MRVELWIYEWDLGGKSWILDQNTWCESGRGIAGCSTAVLAGVFQCTPIAREDLKIGRESLVLVVKVKEFLFHFLGFRMVIMRFF